MTTARESVYVVPDERSSEAITRGLVALLPVRERAVGAHRFTVLDTADGRVERVGASLTRAGGENAPTVNWQTGAGAGRVTMQLRQPVCFEWDLPSGPLRQQVASVIGPRRLLAQADAEQQGSVLDMVDGRGKTVARLRVASGQARAAGDTGWRPLPTTITLTGLRGYEEVYERLVPVVESRPGIQRRSETPVGIILRHVGTPEPRDLSSAVINLDPDVRADIGARRIHLALLDILVANEPGLRAAIDTEFLHDFRVAIRRARSLLGQIRGVFPQPAVEHFKAELTWIGRATGPARDTDVLVLALRQWRERFSATEIDAIIAFLGRTQQQECERLVRALDSERYRQFLFDWRAFLASPPLALPAAPHAEERLAATIARRARRLTKRIVRSAVTIDEDTSAEQLHDIRIDAKKLRYLLDAMPAIAADDDVECMLGALKKLQRALGDFNDAHIQQTLLLDCGRGMGEAGTSSGTLLTLGALAEQRRHRRDRLRRSVSDTLKRFRSRSVRKACRRIFEAARTTPSVK